MIGPLGENLVFVMSQPRSGSTLLQRVLAGNPRVFTTAESWLALSPCHQLSLTNLEGPAVALRDFLPHLPEGSRSYLKAVSGMLRELYNAALDMAGKEVFLEKTPAYSMIVPELQIMFPEAKFVYLFRNPLAILASFLDIWRDDFSFERHADALVEAPRRLLAGAQNSSIRTQYEELVLNPGEEVCRLCILLGLEYHPDMLNYGSRPALDGHMQDPTGQRRFTRPVADSLDKWKTILARPENYPLAHEYLRLLSDEVCDGIGYPKQQLAHALTESCGPCNLG